MPLTRQQATFIFNQNVGCRYGTDTNGAAYGFMDIEGAGQDGHDPPPSPSTIMAWLRDPNAVQFQPRWDDRLWNTCGVIVSMSPAGTVLLVSKAAPTAERYLFADGLARGDRYSFRKCNRLPPDAQILATIPYGAAMDAVGTEADAPAPTDAAAVTAGQVQDLFDKIMTNLAKLAG